MVGQSKQFTPTIQEMHMSIIDIPVGENQDLHEWGILNDYNKYSEQEICTGRRLAWVLIYRKFCYPFSCRDGICIVLANMSNNTTIYQVK